MRNDKQNIIVNKSFDFALDIVEFTEQLYSKNRFALANQIFKSGTSIGANIHEAQNAESKNDFIHKMKISAKETDETGFWLKLCEKSPYLPSPDERMTKSLQEIHLILNKIISTSKSGS